MASCEDETEDLSTCSVCFNQYDKNERIPKFLPCSHTFCLLCLKGLYSLAQQAECPICRNVTVLAGGVETLPKNLFALHLILVNNNLKEVNELLKKPQWCLTCGCLAKLVCIKTHSTVNMCQDAEGMQRKMCESQDIMNETLEKRFAVQQHFEAVLHSLKEAELSTREQAEINNEHIVHLMSTLETVDKLKNGNEDVSDARETIDTIFHQAEKQLQEAAQLLVECCDQTEIRVWINKLPDSSTIKDLSENQQKPVKRIQMKVTETSKICSLNEKTSVVSCSFLPKKSLLACGLDNGKWCLFKDDSTCSPFSDWAANLYGSPETTGSSALCIDWDLSGSRIAIGFSNGTVEAWNTDGEMIFSRKIHTDNVTEVLWNKKEAASSDLFLTRSSDSSAAVFSAVLGSLVQAFPSSSPINNLTWIKEECFATLYENNTFALHQLGKESPIQIFDNDIDDSIFGLLCVDNDKLITCTDYGFIQIWSLDCEEFTQQLECDYPVYCIDFFEKKSTSVIEESGFVVVESSQQLLAGGLENGTIQVWDAANLSDPIKTIQKCHSKSVDKVSFSCDGEFLASLSFTANEIIIWCTKTWEKVHECKIASTQEVVASSISWTGNGMLAFAKGDREVMVIEID